MLDSTNDRMHLNKEITMYSHTWLATALVLLATIGAPMAASAQDDKQAQIEKQGQDEKLSALDGDWVFVEDRTEGRAADQGRAPTSARFTLRVEKDAVIYPRQGGDERITLDGSIIEKKTANSSLDRFRGEWKKEDGWLEYTLENMRSVADDKPLYVIKKVFRITDDGLLVYVFSSRSRPRKALYRHPEDIELPEPANATIADMAWLAGVWAGTMGKSAIEERWSPTKGGAMLGVARTVREDKMVAFEFLRIVERDGGLVYVAQPGGRPPTEFVLTELDNKRAVFANPRHDFPQRIIYEVSQEGDLTASIGYAKGRLQSFEFKREEK